MRLTKDEIRAEWLETEHNMGWPNAKWYAHDEKFKLPHYIAIAEAEHKATMEWVVEDLNKEADSQHTHRTYDIAEKVLRQKAQEYSKMLEVK